jgi:hypothetical protein
MTQPATKIMILIFMLSTTFSSAFAVDRQGRMGVGVNGQLINSLPALSMKLQKSRSFAFGGVFGLSTKESGGGYGAGLKVYRIIFDEPNLNFYASALFALINQKKGGVESQSGFQIDLTVGPEFHFNGLESIGFSFEFGLSMNKLNEFAFETVGSHFIVAGVHFYL